eukprot:gnl/Chilomastix_cuspidata/3011.p1 GENE.gnl/Chilomastix_cuspidata/3011~~gnl/Chilomastix_cuspidata/3011.p1  ORF type:complete len:1344 (+),score=310.33 gnl/Chilomastix_cuspidata/3011:43-4074(+)
MSVVDLKERRVKIVNRGLYNYAPFITPDTRPQKNSQAGRDLVKREWRNSILHMLVLRDAGHNRTDPRVWMVYAREIYMFSLQTTTKWKVTGRVKLDSKPNSAMYVSQTRHAWFGCANGSVYIFDVRTRSPTRIACSHEAIIRLRFEPLSQRIYTCSVDGDVKEWDPTALRVLATFKTRVDHVSDFCVARTRDTGALFLFVLQKQRAIRVFETRDGEAVREAGTLRFADGTSAARLCTVEDALPGGTGPEREGYPAVLCGLLDGTIVVVRPDPPSEAGCFTGFNWETIAEPMRRDHDGAYGASGLRAGRGLERARSGSVTSLHLTQLGGMHFDGQHTLWTWAASFREARGFSVPRVLPSTDAMDGRPGGFFLEKRVRDTKPLAVLGLIEAADPLVVTADSLGGFSLWPDRSALGIVSASAVPVKRPRTPPTPVPPPEAIPPSPRPQTCDATTYVRNTLIENFEPPHLPQFERIFSRACTACVATDRAANAFEAAVATTHNLRRGGSVHVLAPYRKFARRLEKLALRTARFSTRVAASGEPALIGESASLEKLSSLACKQFETLTDEFEADTLGTLLNAATAREELHQHTGALCEGASAILANLADAVRGLACSEAQRSTITDLLAERDAREEALRLVTASNAMLAADLEERLRAHFHLQACAAELARRTDRQASELSARAAQIAALQNARDLAEQKSREVEVALATALTDRDRTATELARVRAELEASASITQALENTLQDTREKLARMIEYAAEARRELADRTRCMDQYEAKLGRTEELLQTARGQAREAESSAAALRKELHTNAQALSERERETRELAAAANALRERGRLLEQQVELRETRCRTLLSEREGATATLEETARQLAAARESASELERRRAEAEANSASLIAQNEELSVLCDRAAGDRAAMATDLAALRAKLREQAERATELSENVSNATAEVDAQRTAAAEQRAGLLEAVAENKRLGDRVAEQRAELERHAQQAEASRGREAQLSREANLHKARLADATAEASELARKLRESDKTRKKLSHSFVALTETNERLAAAAAAALGQAAARIRGLEVENGAMRTKLDACASTAHDTIRLARELENLRVECDVSSAHARRLEERLSQQAAAHGHEREHLRKRIAELEEEVARKATAEGQLAAAEERLATERTARAAVEKERVGQMHALEALQEQHAERLRQAELELGRCAAELRREAAMKQALQSRATEAERQHEAARRDLSAAASELSALRAARREGKDRADELQAQLDASEALRASFERELSGLSARPRECEAEPTRGAAREVAREKVCDEPSADEASCSPARAGGARAAPAFECEPGDAELYRYAYDLVDAAAQRE